MKKIVVLTGAGISAPSGIPTYRDSDGLWTKYDQNIVSKKGAFETKEGREFWDLISKSFKDKEPNEAHKALVDLEKNNEVVVITTNIDDLHEKAGSSKVIHLHGKYNDFREDGVTPNVVLFGEDVHLVDEAVDEVIQADMFISIGTSDNVGPANSLIDLVKPECITVQINKEKTVNTPLFKLQWTEQDASKVTEEFKSLVLLLK